MCFLVTMFMKPSVPVSSAWNHGSPLVSMRFKGNNFVVHPMFLKKVSLNTFAGKWA